MLKKGSMLFLIALMLLLLLPFLLINFINLDNSFAYFNIKSGPPKKLKPLKSNASSKILLDYTKERITKSFEDISTEHEIIKVLNKKGVKKYSTLRFPFSKKNQKLKVYFIKIIKPDGNITNINLNTLRTVTAPFNPEAPIFSNQLLKTIQLPGLLRGSTIDYKYKSTTVKPYMKNNFFTEDYFGGLSPLKKSIYKLIIPKGIYYRYAEYRFNEKPRIINGHKNTTLIWILRNRKKITPEELGPRQSAVIPHVMVSSVKSWDEVARWYSHLTKDQIKPGISLVKFIKKLTESKEKKLKKIEAVYDFVAKKIRYVGYEFGIDGYKPSKVNSIFKNRMGDCKDHATLFASMLNQIGVKAYPVLIPSTEIPNMNPKLPTPFVFDHEITAIPLNNNGNNGKFMFADTTSNVTTFGDLPPMDQGRNVLIIAGGKGILAKTPVFMAEKNNISTKEYATIKSGGNLAAETTIAYTGAYDMYKRYLYSSTSKRKKRDGILKNILNIAPNAKLAKYSFENGNSLSKPYLEKISFSAKNYAGGNDGIVLVRIPIRTRTALSRITALNHRNYSLKLGYNFSENSIVTLRFPEDYKLIFIPKGVKIKNTVGTFKTSYKVKNNMIIFKSSLSVIGYKIDKKDYRAAKRLFNTTIKNLSDQVLIFNKSE